MKNLTRLMVVALAALILVAAASDTERWIQGSRTEFLKGEPRSASITSMGSIILPPVAEKIFPAAGAASIQPFIWRIAVDKTGAVFAAGGNDGIIYDGRGNPVHDAQEPEIYAMAVGPDNRLYFGSSPNGAVYRMKADGTAEVFFTPRRPTPPGSGADEGPPERYIWDMAFGPDGSLYVASGIEGRVYKVSPEGSGSIAFDSDEANITCIEIDSRGRVLFGSDPGGQIFQMDEAGNVFVLFDSPMKEISCIATTADGVIYATGVAEGAVEEKQNGSSDNGPKPILTRTGSITVSATSGSARSNGEISAAYRILSDGSVEKIWSSMAEVAYAVAADANGSAVIGTGPKGMLISVNRDGIQTVLRNLDGKQVTAVAEARGALYAGVSNLGAVFRIANRYAATGEFLSQVKDTGAMSDFGTINWHSEGQVAIHTRSGNTSEPDNTWSDWSSAYSTPATAKISSPSARYIQWKAVLSTSVPDESPSLKSVSLYYLQRNMKPRITSVGVLPVGITFKDRIDDPDAMEIPVEVARELEEHDIRAGSFGGSGKAIFRRHMRTLRWTAADGNDDTLLFDVKVRDIGSDQWITLATRVTDEYYSFDSRSLPDSTYVARVEASDAASNPGDRARSGWLDTQPFDIDNAPPVVEGLAATTQGGTVNLSFTARDSGSSIRALRIRVNDGPWMVVLPTDGIPDSLEEQVQISLDNLSSGNHFITVRVEDELYNVGSAGTRVTVR